jgi:hypothetical protein
MVVSSTSEEVRISNLLEILLRYIGVDCCLSFAISYLRFSELLIMVMLINVGRV